MVAVLLVLAVTVVYLLVLRWFFQRGRVVRLRPRAHVDSSAQPAGATIAGLDDASFRTWLGVTPATYDRYVDTGLEDLEILLADRPARGREDPATPG